jgi:SAM-dependent methyltransferase
MFLWTFPPAWKHFVQCAFDVETAQRHGDNPNWARDIFIERCLGGRKIERVLSLCCGFGHVERAFIRALPTIRSCIGIDIAPDAVVRAANIAAEEGLSAVLSYQVADLNSYPWEALGTFDLVIANGALHHIRNLEDALSGIKCCLAPDGWLFASECIGPSYRDHPARQLELINAFFYLLPPALRGRPATPFRHRQRLLRSLWIGLRLLQGRVNVPAHSSATWSLPKRIAAQIGRVMRRSQPVDAFDFGIVHDSQKAFLKRTDPSEGVRSAEIVPLLEATFSHVAVHQYGAALLAYMLDKVFFDTYDPGNQLHVELFERLCAIEAFYIEQGEVQPEYALLFAQP